MNINQDGLDLVKRFEGLRLTSYKDPVGIWTIGYGTTTRAGVGVTVGPNMTITEEQAEGYLRKALDKFALRISGGFTRTPTSNQFSAMLSLAYNIGPGAFLKSTCLKRFNAGDIDGAAEALTWFNKAGGKVLNGLVRRRAAERELFLADDVSVIETPTADGEKPLWKSTTLQGATAAGGTVLAAMAQMDWRAQIVLAVALAGIGWMAWRRIDRYRNGDR
jgi:lysozyme